MNEASGLQDLPAITHSELAMFLLLHFQTTVPAKTAISLFCGVVVCGGLLQLKARCCTNVCVCVYIYIYILYIYIYTHAHIYIYDPGSAGPPTPPPLVVWCGFGLLPSPPCGVVWCGCGLFPPSLWCGVVRVWALVVPRLPPLWRGVGWVVPPCMFGSAWGVW